MFNSFIYGQRIGFDKIDDSRVSSWMPETKAEYQGVYSVGDSEMESSLRKMSELKETGSIPI